MIIYIKENNVNYIACSESGALSFTTYEDKICPDNLAMWKVKNRKRVYAGFGKLNRVSDILRYDSHLFAKQVNYENLINYTVPRMRDILQHFNCLKKDKYWENELLVISEDKAFLITQNLFVRELGDFCAVGSNEGFFMGALEVTKNMPVAERIKDIVASINQLEDLNYFPITMINTKTGKKTIIN